VRIISLREIPAADLESMRGEHVQVSSNLLIQAADFLNNRLTQPNTREKVLQRKVFIG
jgi:hypothetical protein